MPDTMAVRDGIRAALATMPALLESVEAALGAHEDAARALRFVDDEDRFFDVMGDLGAEDLAQALQIVANRIHTVLVGGVADHFGYDRLPEDEARAATTEMLGSRDRPS